MTDREKQLRRAGWVLHEKDRKRAQEIGESFKRLIEAMTQESIEAAERRRQERKTWNP